MIAQLLYETHNCVCLSSVPVYGQGILLNLQIVYASDIAAVGDLLQFYLNVRFEPITFWENKICFPHLLHFFYMNRFFSSRCLSTVHPRGMESLTHHFSFKIYHVHAFKWKLQKICITRKIISFSSEAVWNYKDKS